MSEIDQLILVVAFDVTALVKEAEFAPHSTKACLDLLNCAPIKLGCVKRQDALFNFRKLFSQLAQSGNAILSEFTKILQFTDDCPTDYNE